MKIRYKILMMLIAAVIISCNNKTPKEENMPVEDFSELQSKIDAYSPTIIEADLSHLSDSQIKVIELLVEAGVIADGIFWKQTSHSSIPVRDSLKKADTESSRKNLEYVLINYGPYDAIYDNERFVGEGPEKRPEGGAFYPVNITKEEFEQTIQEYPNLREELENQYTIVVRQNARLKGVPYHEMYPETEKLAAKLEEAASYAENPTLKNYLTLRAEGIRKDDYFKSDMAWMDLADNDIDIVIGPIENYEDGLFNYKTAYESVVMVRDVLATKELELFEQNIDNFEQKLPYDKKYIRESAGKGNILQVVNVVYFGGDCQKGVKTIAASLPNDPRVHKTKGAKKSMYKNMMEAKFNKIVIPISKVMLDESLHQFVDGNAFTSFVTLHEVSHTLGRGYVYGKPELTVRKALKERYSAIEELKADIVGMHNISIMKEMGLIDDERVQKTVVTFVAGLYRSIRFGIEEAHGKANMIQLNYLRKHRAIVKGENDKYTINNDKFFDVVSELAGKVLTLQAEGNYKSAGIMLDEYGEMDEATKAEIELLKDVPRDLNTTYAFVTGNLIGKKGGNETDRY